MAELRLRRQRLEWRRVDDEVIAVDLERSTYLSANESGSVLWEALAEGTTREELIEQLATALEVDHGSAELDVDAFLQELTDRDLLDAPTS